MRGLGKKGSTLVYVMVVVAILSLLGVTILSAALTGYHLRLAGGNSRKAFYIAEAGLKQANAIVEQTMRDAVEYAHNEAKANLDTAILADKKIQDIDRADSSKLYIDPVNPENSKAKSPFFYQIWPADGGNKNTYDFNGNITGEYDAHGNEVALELAKYDPVKKQLVKLDETDKNAVLGGVVQAYADRLLNKYFAEAYVRYLTSGNISKTESLKSRLEDPTTYQCSDFENSKEKISDVSVTTIKGFGTLVQDAAGFYPDTTEANTMQIQFKSVGSTAGATGAGTITKTLETEFKIGIPPYDLPMAKGNEIVRLKANALFDKTLCSDNDIIVMGTDVTVNGNIYAKGHDVGSSDTDSFRYGGIIVGDALAFNDKKLYDKLKEENYVTDPTKKIGKLTVNGMISTSGYLQTRNSNSSIVANGNVYCNSLVAQQDWETDDDGVFSNCDILLKKDLNLLDNLNLNCRNTRIEVDGNFFGFSDGSGIDAKHNQSSSIAINDYDIGTVGNTSSLTLKGEGEATDYLFTDESTSPASEQVFKLPNGIYIGGTAYVNYGLVITIQTPPNATKGSVSIDKDGKWTYTPVLTPVADDFTDSFTLNVHNNTFGGDDLVNITVNKNKLEGVIVSNFQTGDSVSIAGNYNAYRVKLSSDVVKKYVGATNFSAYMDFVDIPDTCFDSVAPLFLAQRLPTYDALGNKDGERGMKATEKSLYARMAREQDRPIATTQNLFEFGAGKVNIKTENLRYSLGNFIENTDAGSDFQSMDSALDSHNGLIGDAGYAKYAPPLRIKAREFKYYTKKMSDPQLINYLGQDAKISKLDTQDTIADFFSFPGSSSDNFGERRGNSNDPIYYVSGDSNPSPVLIAGKNSSIPSQINTSGFITATVDTSSAPVKGVIVTAGDVYISGAIDFRGIIVAKGNIYIFDDQKKTFTNDYNPNLLVFKASDKTTDDYNHMIKSIDNNTVVKRILQDDLTELNELGDCFKQLDEWEKEIVFTKDVNNSITAKGAVSTFTSRLSEYVKVSQWKQ